MDQNIGPESKLLLAVIKQARHDALHQGPFSDAWQWLLSDDFQSICEGLGWDNGTHLVRKHLARLEDKKRYPKPHQVVFLETFCLLTAGGYYARSATERSDQQC